MEPIFTLPYSEYVVAQRLAKELPSARGFSLHAPLSRQEKGVDLVVTLRTGGLTRAATLQVKASRTYSPQRPSSRAAHSYAFDTLFNVFDVPEQADFVILVAVYPAEVARESRARASWWAPLIMLFTQAEMRDFLASVRTKAGQPDRMFGFGFDDEAAVFQTRGDEQRLCKPFSTHLLANRAKDLRAFLTHGNGAPGARDAG
jgi:hypothetical protein